MSRIQSVAARPILDSRGGWTVEAEMVLADGAVARASVPQGESAGSREAVSLPAETAVRHIAEVIAPAVRGLEAADQAALDRRLLELDGTPRKSKLGGNALLAISLAAARAASVAGRIPLWRHLRELSNLEVSDDTPVPRLVALMVEGGVHAPGGLSFQEYLLIPRAGSIKESVSVVERFYNELRQVLHREFGPAASRVGDEGAFSPAFTDPSRPFAVLKELAERLGLSEQVDFGLDAAANQVDLPTEELFASYRRLRQEYQLFYLEDPFAEEDFENFARLREEFGPGVLVVGDDLTVTNVGRMAEAKRRESANAVIIKPNQIGTLTETLDAVRLARGYGWRVIVSHRGRETNDDFIADLAFGIAADGIKLGAPARGERVAKYNRLLEIQASFPTASATER